VFSVCYRASIINIYIQHSTSQLAELTEPSNDNNTNKPRQAWTLQHYQVKCTDKGLLVEASTVGYNNLVFVEQQASIYCIFKKIHTAHKLSLDVICRVNYILNYIKYYLNDHVHTQA